MTCITGIDTDGNRFIACVRGVRRPSIDLDVIPDASDDPWWSGRRVTHARYGVGTIVERNAAIVRVAFDSGRTAEFARAYVDKGLTVLQ